MTDAPPSFAGAPRLVWAVRAGLAAALPTQIFVLAFGMVSGVVAAEIGMDFGQTMFLSIAVFAGASQFAIMNLLDDGAPTLIIVAAGVAINVRFMMYAATMSTWLRDASFGRRLAVSYLNVDNIFAVASVWWRQNTATRAEERAAFYLVGGLLSWCVWQGSTAFGFFFGATAPAFLSLEFAAPVAFLALTAPLLIDRPSWSAAFVATGLAVTLHDLPFSLNVLIGGVAGVAAGYYVDRRVNGREGGDHGTTQEEARDDG